MLLLFRLPAGFAAARSRVIYDSRNSVTGEATGVGPQSA